MERTVSTQRYAVKHGYIRWRRQRINWTARSASAIVASHHRIRTAFANCTIPRDRGRPRGRIVPLSMRLCQLSWCTDSRAAVHPAGPRSPGTDSTAAVHPAEAYSPGTDSTAAVHPVEAYSPGTDSTAAVHPAEAYSLGTDSTAAVHPVEQLRLMWPAVTWRALRTEPSPTPKSTNEARFSYTLLFELDIPATWRAYHRHMPLD